jgi:glutathione S-transferase
VTIRLHQFPAMLGIPNPSPFCMKVETWLRLAGLPYEVVVENNPAVGPLGKLPFIEDGGATVADSSSIIAHLSRTHAVKLDHNLRAAQRSHAHALQRMLEEHLYWALVYSRWIEDASWAVIGPTFFASVPALLRPLIMRISRNGVRRDLHGHGLGRHPREEIYRRAAEDIESLSAELGDQPYFLGGEPTSVDASAYAFLAGCWMAQLDTPLKALVGKHHNLTAYCTRMTGRCFAPARA